MGGSRTRSGGGLRGSERGSGVPPSNWMGRAGGKGEMLELSLLRSSLGEGGVERWGWAVDSATGGEGAT